MKFFLCAMFFYFSLLAEETKKDDKEFSRKITDTTKKLKMGSSDLVDTKALLRKTNYPNPEQIRTMKKIILFELGSLQGYKVAARKSPAAINGSLKSLWKIYQNDEDLKEANRFLAKRGITKGLKKYYSEKKEKLITEKNRHSEILKRNLSFMRGLIASEVIASKGEFFDNEVSYKDGVELIDKFGDAKVRLKLGEKVQTKVHKKDRSFYLVKYRSEILFAKRGFFSLK